MSENTFNSNNLDVILRDSVLFIPKKHSAALVIIYYKCTRCIHPMPKSLKSNLLFSANPSKPQQILLGTILAIYTSHKHKPKACVVLINLLKANKEIKNWRIYD